MHVYSQCMRVLYESSFMKVHSQNQEVFAPKIKCLLTMYTISSFIATIYFLKMLKVYLRKLPGQYVR